MVDIDYEYVLPSRVIAPISRHEASWLILQKLSEYFRNGLLLGRLRLSRTRACVYKTISLEFELRLQ